MKPYALLSDLLQYPTPELCAGRADRAAEATAIDDANARGAIERFLQGLERVPLSALRDEYVATFDFDRRASLHLTYHNYGDRRQRGLVLARLKRRFAEHGLELDHDELPDYLPVLLEFAALAPDGAGEALLAELRESLELVRARLHERESRYAVLLDAVAGLLPRLTERQLERVRQLAAEGPPTELVGLDPVPAPAPTVPEGVLWPAGGRRA